MSESHYTVLGIDPAIDQTGWALISPDGHLLGSGTIKPPKGVAPYRDRALKVTERIRELAVQFQPGHVGVEAPWISPINPQTGLELAFLSGCIARALEPLVPVRFFDPGSWRSAIGVRNNKAAVLAHLDGILRGHGIDPSTMTDDECEAYGIAVAALRMASKKALAEVVG